MGTSRGGGFGGSRGGFAPRGRPHMGPRSSFDGGHMGGVNPTAGRKAFARVKQLTAVAEKADEDDEYYFNELARNSRHPVRIHQLKESTLFSMQGAVGLNFDQYDDIKVEKSKDGDGVPVMRSFTELGEQLPRFLSHNIQLMRYDRPTPIQAHSVPVALHKLDLMCCAQTGSGKTCAYLLPLIASMHGTPRSWHQQFEGRSAAPLALVLAPTRELAVQIHIEAQKLSYRSGLHPLVVYGGAKARQQLHELAMGVDILVATPGRLQDFCDRNLVTLSQIKFLVLDEADRMLDMGFEPQIRALHSLMPAPTQRQTLMFSATFPAAVQKLAGEFTRNYVWISVGRVGSTVASIEQRLVHASNNKFHKLALLVEAFANCSGRTLVFVKTKAMATWVARQMRSHPRFRGLRTAEIHGDRTQAQREEALQAFREGHVQVLVATDVAARGLDIAGVAHVVNFDLASTPDEFDSYVHRIGRTGRAGNTGIATSFYVPGYDAKSGCGRIAGSLLQLLRETNQVIPDWFLQLPEVRTLGAPGEGRHHEPKFGGRDVRNMHLRAKSHPQPHQPRFTQGFGGVSDFSQESKLPFQPNSESDGQQHHYPQHRFPPRGASQRFDNIGHDIRQHRADPRGFQDPLPPQQRGGLLPDPHSSDPRNYGAQDHHQQPYRDPRHRAFSQEQQHPQRQERANGISGQHRIREFQPGQPWQASEPEPVSRFYQQPQQHQQQQQPQHQPRHQQQQQHQQWDGAPSFNHFQRSDRQNSFADRAIPQQPRHVVITRQQLQQQVSQSQQQQSFRPLPIVLPQPQNQPSQGQPAPLQSQSQPRRSGPALLPSQGGIQQQSVPEKKADTAVPHPIQKDRKSFAQPTRSQQADARDSVQTQAVPQQPTQDSKQQVHSARSSQVSQQPAVQHASEKRNLPSQEKAVSQAKPSPMDKQAEKPKPLAPKSRSPQSTTAVSSLPQPQSKPETPVNA